MYRLQSFHSCILYQYLCKWLDSINQESRFLITEGSRSTDTIGIVLIHQVHRPVTIRIGTSESINEIPYVGHVLRYSFAGKRVAIIVISIGSDLTSEILDEQSIVRVISIIC